MFSGEIEVFRAQTVQEALALKSKYPEAQFLAGGTDIMVYIDKGTFPHKKLIDIWKIDELKKIEKADNKITIGALCTYSDLIRSELIKRYAPSLREAALSVGALQIQNRGTIGGNIGNASPAGDTLPVLLSLDATAIAGSKERGERKIPADKLFKEYRKLDLQPDEMLLKIELPIFPKNNFFYFRKVGTRQAQSIAKLSFAGRLQIDNGQISEARIAFGAVAPTPIRCKKTEQALTGKPIDPQTAELITEEISPIDDIRSTASYRKKVAVRILKSWLEYLKASN